MIYGLALYGHDNSTPVTTLAPSLIFRGKAAFEAGSAYYPSSEVGRDLIVSFYAPNTNYQIVSNNTNTLPGTYRAYTMRNNGSISYGGGSCSGMGTPLLRVTGTISKTIGIFTYSISCPSKPTVFCYSSSSSTKASLRGIIQDGSISGVPVWKIKVSIGFPLGTSESVFLSHVSLYCFSEVASSDFTSTFGIRTFDANGNPTFCADKKVLKIKDYVTVTASTRPANLSDMIYTRSFAPNPQTSVFALSKPSFLNIDFARYQWNQFAFAGTVSFGNQCYYAHQFRFIFQQQFISAGINVNASNTELEFGVQSIGGSFMFQYVGWLANYPPAPPAIPNSIGISYENFPIIIPIIDGAEYD